MLDAHLRCFVTVVTITGRGHFSAINLERESRLCLVNEKVFSERKLQRKFLELFDETI